ncbi:Cu(I)/Ag(I) efflux system membrane fusion protein [Pedobacter cryoconitis]|uniref:Cu(I)/Ag(I) efflux system membrane fusion protein n=1 Tax=Pedobacter cryoconitis TaxID=188932 RepID=A0A7W8ZKC0_9SPHI|nr:DUF3347 domain-containing protein [Pedobacter cryoconitis]MBB5635465.1 Cu(I)/Ag(I) efflux system membrane fusion protein [Pedobacter cryoconitis]
MKKVLLGLALFLVASLQPALAQKTSVAGQFNQSLKSYYALKNALATDKAEEAPKLALALQKAVKEVPHKSLANVQQHVLWMKESAVIQQKAVELAKTTDLKSQRKSFEGISTAFIKLTTELKLNTQEVFVQYCPMGKFSWLNEVKEIQNPYYGSQMYDCGTVKDTLEKN